MLEDSFTPARFIMSDGRIRRLPDHVINKIAAGEVVERPASIVKELVENALDADATTVTVELRDGGAARIEVADDGVGMAAAELELALERHATSKIGDEDDLTAIATLGFRGEALPAICAVTRFVIVTSPRPGGQGTRVAGEAGRVSQRLAVPASAGTIATVSDLFFNTPARLKFLKTPATELAATLRLLGQLALAHPRVRFRVTNNGRLMLTAPAVTEPRDRVAAVFGAELAQQLLPVEREQHGVRVGGLISPASLERGSREQIVTIVNGRPVRDTLLQGAIVDAFRPLLPRDRFPAAVLAIDVPPADVDVNVHPSKAWVRFRSPRLVQEVVFRAVHDAVRGHAPTPASGPARAPGAAGGDAGSPESAVGSGTVDLAQPQLFEEPAAPYARHALGRLLGQVQDTFVVTATDAEVLFIDQHVAHERVIYERLVGEIASRPLAAQDLLIPQPVALAPAARALLDQWRPLLERLGFVLEEFGGAVALRAVPALLSGQDSRRLIERMLDELRPAGGKAIELERALAFVACRAAIKASAPLMREEMERLVGDLSATETPYFCPHGRPIISRVSLSEIRKELKRTW
jgi:DNA mismatch repair protein MutL